MSEKRNELDSNLTFSIPLVTTESDTQDTHPLTLGQTSQSEMDDMENVTESQPMTIRKRRNLSKNRGVATRYREKTPEPGRTPIPHEDTTTTDEEDVEPQRTSREIEADNTYEEMKRLVQEQANIKDPVYDIDTDEILEARAVAVTERRRRSISPFALPDKEEAVGGLQRKGSFIDPSNKLLSTNYCINLKDEDSNRRGSLTFEPPTRKASNKSTSPPPIQSASPRSNETIFNFPTSPKKLEEIIYPDEITKEINSSDKLKKLKIVNEQKTTEKKSLKETNKSVGNKTLEEPSSTGELVTKVIEIERSPSKKLSQEQKPVVEIRERVVRTPSKKLIADAKPTVTKQISNKPALEQQSKVPPVKPARSKSASRFGSKTSESEMSEDQVYQQNIAGTKRKVIPTPRRFVKNRSPRANRSQSINKTDDLKVMDKTGTRMSQTSKEILELMQKARARSLSIPKDDPRLPNAYKDYKVLQTPNKTPTSLRHARGISCPKTIQIISDKEILSGLNAKPIDRREHNSKKHSRQSSGYGDASQSEYTSSCYSSSPSENEYDFDLSDKTAELTRKLSLLSQEVTNHETKCNIILSEDEPAIEPASVMRKRSLADKNINKKSDKEIDSKLVTTKIKEEKNKGKSKKQTLSRWTLIANWQMFKEEFKSDYNKIISLRNKCICDLIILIIMCGLGGMMFKTLEGSFENAYKCSTRNVKRDFIENLWRGSHYLREEDWKSMARTKLYEFENQLHTAHEAGVSSYSGQKSWNFMNSFVYCLQLVTTIGYGYIAPKTTYGRVATIVYAIIGIPLFLIVLADFGKFFTRGIKFFWAFIRRFYYTRSCRRVRRTAPVQEVMKTLNTVYEVVRRPSQIFAEEDIEGAKDNLDKPPPLERKQSDAPPPLPPKPGTQKEIDNEIDQSTPAPSVFEIDDEFNLPISVAITILLIYIIIGAVCYTLWETWTFFESFYFVFISMSTIGLGDLVPDHPMFMMASIVYLVFGLALTSMCINVVQVKLSNTFRQASAKLGATIGLQVADDDGSLVPITPIPVEMPPVHKPKTVKDDSESKSKDDSKETDLKNR